MKHIIRPLMVGVALAAACVLPAAAQESTPIPPEATALPEGVMFAAPGPCFISPDESNVAVWQDAVYDLPSGTKRFDLPDTGWDDYSPDGQYLFVSGHGLYDVQTGEVLIPTDNSIHNQGWNAFSPDGRLFVDGNLVYDLNTFEQVATLERDRPTYGDQETFYTDMAFVNEGRWLVFDRFDAEHEALVKVYVDTETWETILDGGDYPPGTGVRFSNDYTRYAVGGEGVFSYPSGEKLFDLPLGQVEFSLDSSILLVTTYAPVPIEPTIFTYLNAVSGEEINRFEVPRTAYLDLLQTGLLFEPTLTRIVLPVIEEVGVGENTRPLVRTWQVIEVATGDVLYELERVVEVPELEDVENLRKALWVPISYERWQMNGRYFVQGEGVFDVETDTLMLPISRRDVVISRLGTYIHTVNSCTAWEMP